MTIIFKKIMSFKRALPRRIKDGKTEHCPFTFRLFQRSSASARYSAF